MTGPRTQPLRILVIAERFPPDIGGLARSAGRVAKALARAGAQVEVLAWTRRLPAGKLETVEVPGGAGPPIVTHRLGLYAQWDMSLQHTMNVLEWLHGRRRFDALWGHYLFPAGFAAVLFAELAGIASAVSARGNDVDRVMFPPGDFARLRWTLERATAVSAVSRELARKIGVLTGIRQQPLIDGAAKPPNVFVLPNAVDLDVFTPGPPSGALRQRLGILSEESVLGFSGELRQKKGTEFLLAALRDVRQRGRAACLLIIGEVRAEESSKLAAFAAEEPEAACRIVLTGHQEDPAVIAEHLRLCDVVLQPSLWEGMPNTVLEAMACGRIVIGSDAGGIPEIIETGRNGFVISKHQLNHLGNAVEEALALGMNERNSIKRAARSRVEEMFSPDVEQAGLQRILSALKKTANQP